MAAKRKTLTLAVTITVPVDMSARQAKTEVRTLITEQCNWKADEGDVRAKRVSTLRFLSPDDPPLTPAQQRELLRDIMELYRSTGDEGSEEAEAVEGLPATLNSALADVIRWAVR